MLKKIMFLLGCVGILLLVACGNRNNDDELVDYETSPSIEGVRPDETVDFEFSIDIIADDELEDLDDYTTINYRDGDDGLNLIFNFNKPITNFSLIEVTLLNDDDFTFAKVGELENVGGVDEALVLTNYFGYGTLPRSGFSFTTPSGEDVWYTFHQSQMNSYIYWGAFNWSRDYDLYDPDASSQAEAVYHTVTAGETMFSISRMYRTTIETIKELNNLTTYDLAIDQILRMPDGSVKDPSLATHHNRRTLDLGIRVEWLRETVSDYVEFNYAEARNTYVPNAETLLIATDNMLRGFAIIDIDPIPEEFEIIDVMFYVGNLNPYEPLLIREYFGHGTLPRSGFTFIDEDEVRRFFFVLQNQADEGPTFFIGEFEQENFSFWNYEHTY